MRICYIGDARSPHTKRTIVPFIRKGYEIYLITPDGSTRIDGVKMEVIPLDNDKIRIISYLRRAYNIRKAIKQIKPDILHAFDAVHGGIYGMLSGVRPLIITPWGNDLNYDLEMNPVLAFLVKFSLKRAELVSCMDESICERVNNITNYEFNIRLIKEGIDSKKFSPIKRKKTKIIQILCLRRLTPIYNVELLIDAIPTIINKHPNVRFTLLKEGDFIKIKKMITERNVEKYITFIEWCPNEKIPEIMNRADIYVDTFFRETPGSGGAGKTMLEAMSCELPVVSSNVAGVELHIKNGDNGLIYEGRNVRSFSKTIIKLIENKKLRNTLGKNGREYILKEQNLDKNIEFLEKNYLALANKNK